MNQRLPLLALILTGALIARGVEAQQSGLQIDSGSQVSVPNVPQKALLTMTGNKSDVRLATYRVARSQEVFDELWAAHMGARINRAT
ncbi:MAG: hypothetical protein P1V35_13865, partial [Planctomycetota bacterium]|nr:hypothetical protein [Planctomycetota bacterium]